MKLPSSALSVIVLSLAAMASSYAQTNGGNNGGVVSVPDSGPSALLLGIAAVGVLLVARRHLKK